MTFSLFFYSACSVFFCLVFLLFPSSLKLCLFVSSSSFYRPPFSSSWALLLSLPPFFFIMHPLFLPPCPIISLFKHILGHYTTPHLLCPSSLVRLPRSRPVSGAATCARLRGLTPGQVGVCRARGEVMESVRKAAEMVIEEVRLEVTFLNSFIISVFCP